MNPNKEMMSKRDSDFEDSSSLSFAIPEEEADAEEIEPRLSRCGSSKKAAAPVSLHFLRPLSSVSSERRGCSDSCITTATSSFGRHEGQWIDYQKKQQKEEQQKEKATSSPPGKEKAAKEEDDLVQQRPRPRRASQLARQSEQRNLNMDAAADKGDEELSSGSDHERATTRTSANQPSNPGAFAVFPVEGGDDRVAPAAAAAAAAADFDAEAEAAAATTPAAAGGGGGGRERRVAHSAREHRGAPGAVAEHQPRRHTAPLLRQDEMRSITAQVIALDSSITIHEEDQLRTSEHQIAELQQQYDIHVLEMKQMEEQLKDMPRLQRELTTLKLSKAQNVEANVAFTRTEFARQLWLQKKFPRTFNQPLLERDNSIFERPTGMADEEWKVYRAGLGLEYTKNNRRNTRLGNFRDYVFQSYYDADSSPSIF